jgi:hypothetical protein
MSKATRSRKDKRRRVSDINVGLLAYCLGDRHLFAIISDANGHQETFRLIACDELSMRLDVLSDAMDDRFSPQHADDVFQEFSTEWGCKLLPRTVESFDVLVIIPHFMLHGVPLHLIQMNGCMPLGLDSAVTYVLSGSAFVKAINRNKVRKFDLSKWEFPLDQSQPRGCPPPPSATDVLGTRTAEFVDLAKSTDAYCRDNHRLDEDGVFPLGERTLLKHTLYVTSAKQLKAEVYLIIAHGYVDRSSPELSGLLLGGGNLGCYNERNIMFHDYPCSFRDLSFRYFPPEVNARPELNPEVKIPQDSAATNTISI